MACSRSLAGVVFVRVYPSTLRLAHPTKHAPHRRLRAADDAADLAGDDVLVGSAFWLHIDAAPAPDLAGDCDWCEQPVPNDGIRCEACSCAWYRGQRCAAAAAACHHKYCYWLKEVVRPGMALRRGEFPF